jgi:putative FmdB family regulatory protein
MPLYEFYCSDCRFCFDVRRNLGEGTRDVACPLCDGHAVRRVFTPVMAFSHGTGGAAAIGGGACAGCAASAKCGGCPNARGK